MLFAIFGISLLFGTVLEFFVQILKKDPFQKINIEKYIYYLIWCHWT